MERKEVDTQQFIDHTLLATELMHNNFMMDLMDQSGVFPKAEGPRNLSTTNSSTGTGNVGVDYGEKHHTLTPPELNFHNSIFQFVNKHVVDEPNATNSNDVPASSEERTRNSNNYPKETDVEFLTLNDVVPQQGSQPTFPALAIEPTVPIDVACPALQDDELLYAHSVSTTNARKVLPHKKRISRKLKGSLGGIEMELEQHKHQVPVVAPYSCEICGYAVHTQIEFYAHLKEHYDPTSIDQPQQQHQQQQRQQQQKEPLDMCGLSAEDKLQQEQEKLDQVFHDVQLNFDNFHNISHVDDDVVDDVGVNMVIHSDALSLHKADDKLTPNVGSTNPSTSNDVANVVDDVEFSDTEDMLEGIRNVVDKVSIEDTCDELVDLELTSSGMRAPWFNNNFSDIAFSGLLLPGEPPPPTTPPLLKSTEIENEQMALHFQQHPPAEQPTTQQQQHHQSKLDMCHKKHYIETTQANEVGELDKEHELPVRTPTPSAAGSTIEQLQRSPLIINDTFKLEESNADPTDSMPSSPAASVIDDNAELYLLDMEEATKQPGDNDNGEGSELKRKFRCAKCSRDFNSYNALKYHQFTHTKERAFVCITCDRAFYTQGALKAHARTHSGLKPYKCEQCDTRFRQWGDLKYHTDSKHSKLKPHMCEFCGKNFSRKYSLVVHRRIHTCERNYACQYCEKTFRASSYLVAHVKIHTGEKPYACTLCDKKFRVNGDLKRHARIHEPGRGAQRTRGTSKKLKQIEDEDDDEMNLNNKSDAVCGDNEQEILGL
ncbi:serendipity locus protein H-1 [Drosophila sulfurigaster albostrigata]|uniref:serendipity locus protein H-1 n=1 Tax=Drosophila sulfurigaster albostrigata TaxID=89887 RepID=UPI002D21D7F0|nr:serendipity locus protein H-1 [Drosophila sulfurigaster albostrigata]